MGKKSKAERKGKNGKKKDEIVAEANDHDLASVLVQAARSMRTVLSRNLVASGLYAGQDGVMLALAETDGLTAGALAGKLGVKAPTMTRTIGRMEVQGFLERRPDRDDARLTKVYLTELGRDRLQIIAEAGQHSEKLATRGLTDKQVRTLMKLLRAVDSNLQAARAAD
ncbi:MarR family transcriptional regulator [Sinorhizobium meliloti WSM1022]|jgi:DNA-binding MarR family transcriptional regulator|uniref:MarR family winged helix-turn-helix transcriptional regulator n=1 Tax=Rhizobium meliloti TaxID=382 RepID=UPI000418A4C2|nr:MarR family transcriptional regulator [Sinorhizobium meliloti]ASQ02818.1 MarR family transcriptional regulator [Sinorhizobium meliloti]MCO6421137.1 MarR family transcriptional regulator [Sinorhizobium meliloti]MDW9408511.1 MarR family transcriptional regulator [Sinorhizobium meliloti]MDW9441256.1 MarR family transcriptional regulator [Sinorhizobium meliloti]MDW9453735.1 MarR family transcriptional regulator [Sinorhizobium meliloti]